MNEEMDGAMQQAPQPGRQSIAQICVLLSINRPTHIVTEDRVIKTVSEDRDGKLSDIQRSDCR